MTREHEVCRLTGLVLGCGDMVWQFPRHHGPKAPIRSHFGKPLSTPNKQQLYSTRVMLHAKRAVRELLCSSKRFALVEQQHTRLAAVAMREVRTRGTFTALHNAVGCAALRAGRSVALPLDSNNPVVEPLGELIGKHAVMLEVPGTARAVNAMAAALLNKMTRGYCVAGATIVPLVPIVKKHAPAELQHPLIISVQCRAVSSADRAIVTKTTSRTGFAIPEMRFPLVLRAQSSPPPPTRDQQSSIPTSPPNL